MSVRISLIYREIHYHIGEQNNGGNGFNSEQKATDLEKKIKSGNK